MLILFYSFTFISLISSIFVISSKNPIHSIFFLILVFFSSTGLLIILNVEFLAFIYLMVYIGAIAVLFLFVIMMLNIKIIELTEGFFKYVPLSFFIGLIFLIEIFLIIDKGLGSNKINHELLIIIQTYYNNIYHINFNSNMEVLAEILYTHFYFLFFLGGLILLVAMLGSIILTLNQTLILKRQNLYKQISQNFYKAISLKDIKKI